MLWLALSLVAADVTLLKSAEQLQQVMDAAKGKPLVVHFWATWCESCVEEFPQLAVGAKTWREDGVQVVLVSVDDPKLVDGKVKTFLHDQKITFETYLADVTDTTKLMKVVDKSWNGTIPSTFVVGADGTRTGRFIGPAPPKKLMAAVKRAARP